VQAGYTCAGSPSTCIKDPTNLQATETTDLGNGNYKIILNWNDNSDNETGLDFWTPLPPTRSVGFNLNIKF
jgi:hypothetical protein